MVGQVATHELSTGLRRFGPVHAVQTVLLVQVSQLVPQASQTLEVVFPKKVVGHVETHKLLLRKNPLEQKVQALLLVQVSQPLTQLAQVLSVVLGK